MDVNKEVEFIIKQLNDGRYVHAEHSLKRMNEELARKKTVFDNNNICTSCGCLYKGECTATEEYRRNKQINSILNCQVHYEIIKYMDFILHDPDEIKEREKISKEISCLSIEDMLRPFTI